MRIPLSSIARSLLPRAQPDQTLAVVRQRVPEGSEPTLLLAVPIVLQSAELLPLREAARSLPLEVGLLELVAELGTPEFLPVDVGEPAANTATLPLGPEPPVVLLQEPKAQAGRH